MGVVENMRHRAARLRRVANLAHDPAIVKILLDTAREIEADILELEKAEPPTAHELRPLR